MLSWIFGKPDNEPEPLDDVEEVEAWASGHGIGEPFFSRRVSYGTQSLMQDSPRCVLWREVIDSGKSTKIHRHGFGHEIVCVTSGRLLVKEFAVDGEPTTEYMLSRGEAYRVSHGRWHSLTAFLTSEVIITHWPAKLDLNVSSEDFEEWKPARPIGRG